MDLAAFLSRYPDVKVAKPQDDERLQIFFNQSPMNAEEMQLQYLRVPTFHALLDCHSAEKVVFFVENESGVIEGSGTFVIRAAYIRGKATRVCYLGDMRVDNIKRWGRLWRSFYLDLMKEIALIDDFKESKYFYTAILKQNQRAKKALALSPIGYHLFHSYKMVNIFASWRPQTQRFMAKKWSEIESAELFQFHRLANKKKPFGFVFEEGFNEISWREKNWPSFHKDRGFALYDANGIILSCAFWSPSQVKKIIVKRYPKMMKRMISVLRVVLGLPLEGEELKCLYLTMLDKREGLSEKSYQLALQQLVKIGLSLAKKDGYHCVSLPEFSEHSYHSALSSYITLKTDLELYLVDPTRNPVSDFSREIPGFEMCLV
ncbi:MAG: hypothetical protein K2P81_14355 [Bacteriovoracaceae bacterium]|nr:hypothetical protein [Bacteriovoracaceae bacterium]